MTPIENETELQAFFVRFMAGECSHRATKWVRLLRPDLERLLGRVNYIKLKFQPVQFVRSHLAHRSIAHSNALNEAMETRVLGMAPDFLDEWGNLRANYYAQVFDGAPADLRKGDLPAFQRKLNALLQAQRDAPVLADDLGDLCFFALQEQTIHPQLSQASAQAMVQHFNAKGHLYNEVTDLEKTVLRT